jgi:hypothetical protein
MGKSSEDMFLYDEIKYRLTKCMQELEYCRKYSDGFIEITSLSVKIHMIKPNAKGSKQLDLFRLRLLGYPKEDQFNLEDFIERTSENKTRQKNTKTLKYASGKDLMNAMKEKL